MEKVFKLEGLCCANCAAKIENAIGKLKDVEDVSVNIMTTKMVITAKEDQMEQIITEVQKIVHKYEPDVVMKKV